MEGWERNAATQPLSVKLPSNSGMPPWKGYKFQLRITSLSFSCDEQDNIQLPV